MTTFDKAVRIGITATFILIGVVTGDAQGQVATGGTFESSALGTGDLGMQIKGKVICTGCTLEEVQKARPDNWGNHLYRVVYRQHQLVMEIDWVSNERRWSHHLIPSLRLRGADDLLKKLTAEENVFKEIAMSGILSPARILDVNTLQSLNRREEEVGKVFLN